jgi:hypothetical protein
MNSFILVNIAWDFPPISLMSFWRNTWQLSAAGTLLQVLSVKLKV